MPMAPSHVSVLDAFALFATVWEECGIHPLGRVVPYWACKLLVSPEFSL